MAVRARYYAPRRGNVSHWLVGLSVLAAVVAVLPIFAALLGFTSAPGKPRTAFASAPAGTYGVIARTEGAVDVIAIAPLADPAATVEVARVDHLPGQGSTGAVSPEGRRLALVVSDAGTQANPGGSLILVDLETGELTRLATHIDPLQTPTWTPDGEAVVARRLERTGEGPSATATFARVPVDLSGEAPLVAFSNVLGAFAVSFAPNGTFLSVVIDGRGSTLYRGDQEVALLAPAITRDWRLSPDGTQLAFVEASLPGGLTYVARVILLAGGSGGASAQGLSGGLQQAGVAWKPGAAAPTFGTDPSSAGASAQSLSTPGFDVPVQYSTDGAAFVVEHYNGNSFADPGTPALQVIAGDVRIDWTGYTRFFGWAQR